MKKQIDIIAKVVQAGNNSLSVDGIENLLGGEHNVKAAAIFFRNNAELIQIIFAQALVNNSITRNYSTDQFQFYKLAVEDIGNMFLFAEEWLSKKEKKLDEE